MIKIEILLIDREGATPEIFTGSTREEVFEKIYKYRKTYRYCNDVKFKFEDVYEENDYTKWYNSLSDTKKFDLYYSGSIVD